MLVLVFLLSAWNEAALLCGFGHGTVNMVAFHSAAIAGPCASPLLRTRRSCPSGLVASNSSSQYPNSAAWWVNNVDGTQGFTSERACVTPPGWGYSSRIANPCPIGSYNPRDTYGPCTACPDGRTTAAVGAGASLADCGIAQGYGFHDGAVTQCPLGEPLGQRWCVSERGIVTSGHFQRWTALSTPDNAT
jgi:hypothetical protein